jgi:biopolymer transport protein ExbD
MTRISLTPIIDVVFILLIFFMLASNFNKIGELKMDMSNVKHFSQRDFMDALETIGFFQA